jgi:hypothetical protein
MNIGASIGRNPALLFRFAGIINESDKMNSPLTTEDASLLSALLGVPEYSDRCACMRRSPVSLMILKVILVALAPLDSFQFRLKGFYVS